MEKFVFLDAKKKALGTRQNRSLKKLRFIAFDRGMLLLKRFIIILFRKSFILGDFILMTVTGVRTRQDILNREVTTV